MKGASFECLLLGGDTCHHVDPIHGGVKAAPLDDNLVRKEAVLPASLHELEECVSVGHIVLVAGLAHPAMKGMASPFTQSPLRDIHPSRGKLARRGVLSEQSMALQANSGRKRQQARGLPGRSEWPKPGKSHVGCQYTARATAYSAHP